MRFRGIFTLWDAIKRFIQQQGKGSDKCTEIERAIAIVMTTAIAPPGRLFQSTPGGGTWGNNTCNVSKFYNELNSTFNLQLINKASKNDN